MPAIRAPGVDVTTGPGARFWHQGAKEEARAWRERWKLVNDFEREELLRTSMSDKARQLAVLMNTALQLGWQTSTDAEIEAVRNRWIHLKRAALGT